MTNRSSTSPSAELMFWPNGEPNAVKEVKARGKHYVEPRGYAAIPGTGPDGETCGTCKHHAREHYAKVYHKCLLIQAKWTHSGRTDIRVRSSACEKWEAMTAGEG